MKLEYEMLDWDIMGSQTPYQASIHKAVEEDKYNCKSLDGDHSHKQSIYNSL